MSDANFAQLATGAQSVRDWPEDDPEPGSQLDTTIALPEGSMARAEVLMELDGKRHS